MKNLNVLIAQERGYHIEYLNEHHLFDFREMYHVALIAPKRRKILSAWYSAPDDFALVFKHAQSIDKLPGCDWEHRLDDAMPLLLELPKRQNIEFNGWWVVRWEFHDEHDESPYPQSVTGPLYDPSPAALATAISKAWLQSKGIDYDEP